MEHLLCDSDHERLRDLRKEAVRNHNDALITISMIDFEFLLRYIGELEAERWSYYHG